jgi:hypothetical protein
LNKSFLNQKLTPNELYANVDIQIKNNTIKKNKKKAKWRKKKKLEIINKRVTVSNDFEFSTYKLKYMKIDRYVI